MGTLHDHGRFSAPKTPHCTECAALRHSGSLALMISGQGLTRRMPGEKFTLTSRERALRGMLGAGLTTKLFQMIESLLLLLSRASETRTQ